KKNSDRRAVVAVRSNATPVKGQWKLFLDHRFALNGELHPTELYNLAVDQREQDNLLNTPGTGPAQDYLLKEAAKARGDNGSTRP
ncbi:MAG: hypothetical protein VYC95_04550, partial [Verrucomicrobiota bacterium]|nr:hypothetical protein [Verrucomicrobiota bacterium]